MGKLKIHIVIGVLILLLAVSSFYIFYSNQSNLPSKKVSTLDTSISTIEQQKFSSELKSIQQQNKGTFILKDAEGNEFETFFYSPNAKKRVASPDEVWAGIDEGDILIEGDFKLAFVDNQNQKIRTAQIDFLNYQYNVSRRTVYLIPSNAIGQPDLIAVSTVQASNGETAKLFYIKQGQFVQVKVNYKDVNSEELNYSGRPKAIGKNLLQTMNYFNAGPVGYSFTTYQIDLDRDYLILTKTKDYFDSKYENGKAIYEEWINDKDFFVN